MLLHKIGCIFYFYLTLQLFLLLFFHFGAWQMYIDTLLPCTACADSVQFWEIPPPAIDMDPLIY